MIEGLDSVLPWLLGGVAICAVAMIAGSVNRWLLRRLARRAYNNYMQLRGMLASGALSADKVREPLLAQRRVFNESMAELRRLDPSAPNVSL